MPRARPHQTRYELVTRRAVLKAGAGVGIAALIPGIACGNDDAEIFAGGVAELPTATPLPTSTPVPTPTTQVTVEPTPTPEPSAAVTGDLVVAFTYTQAAGGKNERPYIAVWLEDLAGNLVQTVSLWYEQGRRGERWLDHLTRWYAADLAGGATDTISSATRAAGSYTVAWDGTVDGQLAPPGDYAICIEAAREDGPYSLVCAPVTLTGSLTETALADDGELSAVSVRIDA